MYYVFVWNDYLGWEEVARFTSAALAMRAIAFYRINRDAEFLAW